MNHTAVAQDLLLQSMAERSVDVAIVSEPYRIPDHPHWLGDRGGTAAVVWRGSVETPPLKKMAHGEGFVMAGWGDMRLVSCYAPPRWDMASFEDLLENLRRSLSGDGSQRVIIAGDFNAWSPLWGSVTRNARGLALEEWASSMGLVVVNVGHASTCVGWRGESIVDITLASPAAYRRVRNWRVEEDGFSFSDHRYISFDVCLSGGGSRSWATRRNGPRGWAARKLDGDLFEAAMAVLDWAGGGARDEGDLVTRIETMRNGLWEACDVAMPRRGTSVRKKALHWWNEEIAEARRRAGGTWRRLSRAKRRGRQDEAEVLRERLRAEKRLLRTAIRSAKEKAWTDFLETLDRDPWGRPYKLVTNKLKPWAPPETEALDPDFLREVVAALFPWGPPLEERTPERAIPWKEKWAVTEQELTVTAKKAGGIAKAPGPDGIPGVILRRSMAFWGERLGTLFTDCLRGGYFPPQWKQANLVLLHKDGKPRDSPSSFRPICLIDELGKALERIIAGRIIRHLKIRGPKLSKRQFGFREGLSTMDAIMEVREFTEAAVEEGGVVLAVSLDISNAFNSLPWPQIMKELQEFGLPTYIQEVVRCYLSGRVLQWRDGNGTVRGTQLRCGVPQGSVLGPLLWNLTYNRVVRSHLPPRCTMVCYADDTLVLAAGDDWEDAVAAANAAVATTVRAITGLGLKVAPHKTETMFFHGRSGGRPPRGRTRVAGVQVETGSTLSYLGLKLDSGWRFIQHFKNVVPRVDKMAGALSRLLPNLGGPGSAARRLYVAVVHSVLLYGAPVWAEELKGSAQLRRMVHGPQRRIAARVARAYRTVSFGAVTAIAGVMPAELLAGIYAYVFAKRRACREARGIPTPQRMRIHRERARAAALEEWVASLADRRRRAGERTLEAVGPILGEWIGRGHGHLGFRLTQVLTGHGVFAAFLHSIGRKATDRCYHCDDARDTADHTLRECPAWRVQRLSLVEKIGEDLSLAAVMRKMVESEEGWRAATSFAEDVMTLKEEAERERERAAAATPPLPVAP